MCNRLILIIELLLFPTIATITYNPIYAGLYRLSSHKLYVL